VAFTVRERGLGALKEPANVERLSRCDKAARAKIKDRIRCMAERGEVGVGTPPIDDASKNFVTEMESDPEFQRIWQPAVCEFCEKRL
jgi:hypothetical protein